MFRASLSHHPPTVFLTVIIKLTTDLLPLCITVLHQTHTVYTIVKAAFNSIQFIKGFEHTRVNYILFKPSPIIYVDPLTTLVWSPY